MDDFERRRELRRQKREEMRLEAERPVEDAGECSLEGAFCYRKVSLEDLLALICDSGNQDILKSANMGNVEEELSSVFASIALHCSQLVKGSSIGAVINE
ncbi:hypothetical protein BTVI_40269 [Pitangus sulphuratus]|nr:hypothetical protein BTVI_40269 [Pitangus sulphuratus]